jgi:ribonuclease Z
MKPPTIIVPISVKEDVEKLFEIHKKMDQSELKHNLIGLDVGNCCSQSKWRLQLSKIETSKKFHLCTVQLILILDLLQEKNFPWDMILK